MEQILLLDFELNNPLTYLDKFKRLLKDENWNLDLFWARDYNQKDKPSLDDKLNSTQFLLIRKPLTFLSSPKVRKKIQNNVLKEKKSLLIMYTFSEIETLELLNSFLEPFKIQISEIQVIDKKTNLKNKHEVIFHKKSNCFSHNSLFNNIDKIVISDAHHIYVNSPSKILIQGNPSTELQFPMSDEIAPLTGSEINISAYYEETGLVTVINSTLFLNKYFDFNKKFIKNIITWMGNRK